MEGKRVAILGAAGLVGSRVIEILEERRFPVADLKLYGTSRSQGTRIQAFGETLQVETLSPGSFRDVDLWFFAASAGASREYAPRAVEGGAVVIDKSNAFRMDDSVPLVVPEVNSHHLQGHRGIICSPNCTTIQMVVTLKPIEDAVGLKRVTAVTYQSVSGTGRDAIRELQAQSLQVLSGEPTHCEVYPEQIAFNVIPHIDQFSDDDYTGEEWKLIRETQKILDRPDLAVSATCVRVPVFVGHSESVLIETRQSLAPDQARALLEKSPSIEVLDDPERALYPLPSRSSGSDRVFVGRIRRDLSSPDGLWLWIVADNLRKGAATNAVQIAETVMYSGSW